MSFSPDGGRAKRSQRANPDEGKLGGGEGGRERESPFCPFSPNPPVERRFTD